MSIRSLRCPTPTAVPWRCSRGIWEDKITKDHPEPRAHLEQVLATVTEPDHAEPDPRATRRRYYRRRVGPSRWLLVVVSFEQQPGRSITAVAKGHVLRFEPGTQRIVGLTVINARWLLDRDGRLTITIPETVEASAEDLAAALAAA
jgi:hypothetical protein